MAIYNRACIYRQDTQAYLHLPPFGPLVANVSEISSIQLVDIPMGSLAEVSNRAYGWDIQLEGKYIQSTPQAGLVYQDTMRSHLRDTDGTSNGPFDVVLWADTNGSIKQIYRNCYLSSGISFGDSNNECFRPFSLGFKSKTFTRYSACTNGTLPDASPWEQFIWNSTGTGSPTGKVGSGITTDGGTTIIPITFIGTIVNATDGTNYNYLQYDITLSTANSYTITGIEIVNCAGVRGTSGSTTVAVSNTPYTTHTNEITASVAYNAYKSSLSTGSISIAANGKAYVYVTAAAKHEFPTVHIHARSA